MGYIHNIQQIYMVDDINRRVQVLSKLQKEFYDLVVEFAESDPLTMASIAEEEEWESYLRGLRADIKTMNAAELRHNIKIWKESDEVGAGHFNFGRK